MLRLFNVRQWVMFLRICQMYYFSLWRDSGILLMGQVFIFLGYSLQRAWDVIFLFLMNLHVPHPHFFYRMHSVIMVKLTRILKIFLARFTKQKNTFLLVTNPPTIAGDVRGEGSIPGSGRSPGGRTWQPAPVFLGESHGQRSLAGYSPWGHKESDTTLSIWAQPILQSKRICLKRDKSRLACYQNK